MKIIKCEAADPGDMDFCLQCPFFFECDLKDALSSVSLLETEPIYSEV